MLLIINESKSNQNLVHYLSYQAVRHHAYCNSALTTCLKAMASGGTMVLASEVQTLALIFWHCVHYCL